MKLGSKRCRHRGKSIQDQDLEAEIIYHVERKAPRTMWLELHEQKLMY